MKTIAFDTNVWLSNPELILELSQEKDSSVIITESVLQEIDKLNHKSDSTTQYKCRRAIETIEKVKNEKELSVINNILNLSADDNFLELVLADSDFVFYTYDKMLALRVKLISRGEQVQLLKEKKDFYTGIEYIDINSNEYAYNEVLDRFLSDDIAAVEQELIPNKFFVLRDKGFDTQYAFRLKDDHLTQIFPNGFSNKIYNRISSRNTEQSCLIDLLKDDDVKIVAALGKFGTGKSFLLTNYAASQLEAGRISKIIYVPNNAEVRDSRGMGYLPGDLYEKNIAYMGTVTDMFSQLTLDDMINKEQFEIAPLSTMRGRNFTNSIVIVNEAQNLTEDHVKLLLGRIGEGTRIFFDGDLKQVDSPVYKEKSGLKLLLKLKDSPDYAPIFGAVKLLKGERSFTACAADYLDSIV